MVCGEYKELKLIRQLHTLFNFDHIVYLLHPTVDINCLVNGKTQDDIIPQSLFVLNGNSNKIAELESFTELKSKRPLMIVILESPNIDLNSNLLHHMKEIQSRQVNLKIGLFLSHLTTMQDLQKLFRWCKEHQIVNIFAATNSFIGLNPSTNHELRLNIFTYNPFGTFDVINVTESKTYKSFFPILNCNFQQHQLKLIGPSTLRSNSVLWDTVIHRLNGSFIIIDMNYSSLWECFANGMDIRPVLYTQDWNISSIYPVLVSAEVMLVPESLPYSEFSSYLRTITSDEFFGYSAIGIAAVTLLLSIFRYIKHKKILLFQTVADVLNLLMNDNATIEYQQLSRSEVCIIVPLTFVGFFIVNSVWSSLESHLTKPILQPQINTLEDLYRSSIPILTWDEEWRDLLNAMLTNTTPHRDWYEKINVVEQDLFDKKTMDDGYEAFLLYESYANLLLKLQKRWNIKRYRLATTRISNYLYSYDASDKILLSECINEIISWIQQAGLYNLWFDYDNIDFEKEFNDRNFEALNNYKGSKNVQTNEAPMFIVYGWIASVIVFIIEIIWKKFLLLRFNIIMKKFGVRMI